MKHLSDYSSFSGTEIKEALNERVMTINDISDTFTVFYHQLNDLSTSGALKSPEVKKHLQEAIDHLDKAWEILCEEHGVEYEKMKVKI